MEKRYTKEDVRAVKKIVALQRVKFSAEKKFLSRYDYYMLGGINLKKAYGIVYNMYENRDITSSELDTIRRYIIIQNSYKTAKGFNNVNKIYFQYGDYVISDEEKKLVYNSLIEHGISDDCIDELVFSAAVREYAKSINLVNEKKNNSKHK